MNKAIGFIVCGFSLAACSGSVPGLDFLKSSPQSASLRFESAPPGAEVKVAGKTCRTPCELTLELADHSATFTRKGYQPQTIPVHSEGNGMFSTPRLAPNPVHADLLPAGRAATNRTREKLVPGGHDTSPEPLSADASAAAASTSSAGFDPGEVK